jgi:hypothetical protein
MYDNEYILEQYYDYELFLLYISEYAKKENTEK